MMGKSLNYAYPQRFEEGGAVSAAKPEYKFKFYDRDNPITGQKEYQTLMMTEVDGKPVTYRSGFQRSKQAAQDDINRMIAGINATQSGSPRTVKQNYGSSKTTVGPSEEIKSILESGGSLSAPETYTTQRGNQDGTVTLTTYDQRGIRQAAPITTLAANMLDPNYDATLDAVVDPATGQPIFQNPYAPMQNIDAGAMAMDGGIGSLVQQTGPESASQQPTAYPYGTSPTSYSVGMVGGLTPSSVPYGGQPTVLPTAYGAPINTQQVMQQASLNSPFRRPT